MDLSVWCGLVISNTSIQFAYKLIVQTKNPFDYHFTNWYTSFSVQFSVETKKCFFFFFFLQFIKTCRWNSFFLSVWKAFPLAEKGFCRQFNFCNRKQQLSIHRLQLEWANIVNNKSRHLNRKDIPILVFYFDGC